MLFSFQFVLLRWVSAGILGTFYQPLLNIEEMRSGKGTERQMIVYLQQVDGNNECLLRKSLNESVVFALWFFCVLSLYLNDLGIF